MHAAAHSEHSTPGQAVYDPFLGNGTTLIAAQTAGRCCLGLELEPLYVDVAVRRWQVFTGEKATRLIDSCPFDTVAAERPADIGKIKPESAPRRRRQAGHETKLIEPRLRAAPPRRSTRSWRTEMRGRRPKPTRLKVLTGNPGKRPLNNDEPRPDVAIPECPAALGPVGRQEWNRLVGELATLKLLTNLDRAALAAYCGAYALWAEATEQSRSSAPW